MTAEMMAETAPRGTFEEEAGRAARLLKLLANEQRLLILCHLSAAGEMPVNSLVQSVGLGQSALSQHLAKLRADGVVQYRREGTTLYYRVADARAETLLGTLRGMFCPDMPGCG
jgi:DNA-binding transcriptional ArsR family regulator